MPQKIPGKAFLFVFLALFFTIATFNVNFGEAESDTIQEEKVWDAENIEMVHLHDANQYVSDPDSIMLPAMRDTANMYLRKLETECGIQSAFIIVKRVKNQDVYRMAQDLGNRYGVGGKESRSGLIIVIATADKKYFIAPGQGLEGDLPDALCGEIGRAFIAENMGLYQPNLAVVQTCNVIYNKMKTGKVVMTDSTDEPETSFWEMVIALGFFVAIIVLLRRRLKNNNGNFDGGSLGGGMFDTDGGYIFTRSDPFDFGGGGSSRGGGGSYGGGTFGGGGAGGSW